jgi:outer membrane protein insertion porin family
MFFRKAFWLLAVAAPFGVLATQAHAQDVGACARPDSIAVRGNQRVAEGQIRGDAGLVAGTELNYRILQRAVQTLFATGQFDDIRIGCETTPAGKTIQTIEVKERPVLGSIAVTGTDRVSDKSVRDRIELLIGRPIDPALVAKAVERIDSLYEASGYYLARIEPETTTVNNQVKLTFKVSEGRRLAVSGIDVKGNRTVSDADVVGAMKTKPEGFWWFRRGTFDEEKFAADLGDVIPKLYASKGFIDFQIQQDTMQVDRDRGKALISLNVREGPRYRVRNFDVIGNKRFPTQDVKLYYPFTGEGPTVTQRVTDFLRRRDRAPTGVFDESRWEQATERLKTAYNNEGYIYATVRPVVERHVGTDSSTYVDLRWEIDEKTPAIVNRVEISGNDYTTEACIRDQLVLLPGQVFNQNALIRSYQSISNLGFFEAPIPPPDTRTANDQGDVDIVFNVKEKRTGNVNFGASMGQGTGVGGFIGLDQPNLFGLCRRGSLQWQFGRYINDFNLSYTDPRIKKTMVSGTVSAYRTLARYNIANLGRSLRTGGSVQFGFLVPNSLYSRLFVSYGGEAVSFGNSGLLGQTEQDVGDGFRSTLGLTLTRDTRSDMPFASGGSMQTFSAQFNGGPLGGSAAFQRYTTEARSYATLAQFGGRKLGSQPIKLVTGLTARAGSVLGNTGPFFFSQEFALGGVQFGEQLRGYEEFSISPRGFVTGTSTFNAQRTSFGKAFFTTSLEMGLRLNQALYGGVFYDAGNVWAHPRDFDPTRLFRGAGFTVSTVTPLGPLGLDYAYGFDRLNAAGKPAPKWQLHFRLGQLF